MNIHIFKESNALSQEIATWMTSYISDTLKKQDHFTIALSGGSTPQKLHLLLAAPPYKQQIDWSKLHIFWGDERAVPFTDNRNNAKMAYDTFLNDVAVPASQIHPMRTDISPEESAHEYEKILHHYFDNKTSTFDLVLLGMGDDGHTLSLFPGTEVIHEKEKWVTAFFLEAQKMYRITLTAPIVNKASCIAFLVSGSSKAKALNEVLKGKFNPEKFPSQLIKPTNGQLHWFMDEASVAEIV